MRINLLTNDIRLKVEGRRILRLWAVLWGMAALVAGTFFVWQGKQCRDVLNEASCLECKCKPLHELEEKLGTERRTLANQTKERDRLVNLQPQDNVLTVFAALAKSARQQPGAVQVQRFSLLGSAPLPDGKATGKSTEPSRASAICSLQGVANDDATLAQYISGLRESNAFQSVELKSSTQTPGEGARSRQYQIECRLESQP